MSDRRNHVFLVAAESSGDQLGAGLILELQRADDNLIINGIGGRAMADAGVASDFDISPLAILGFTEAIKAYPVVLKKVRQAVDMIMTANPATVVLIDSWGFMIRIAQRLKRAGFKGKIVKYVAPQVWAMREGRAKILAKSVDHLLTIHSFDAPFFERHGLPVTFIGNPMFDDPNLVKKATDFKTKHGVSSTDLVCAVLFGSRPSEIERLFEPFAKTIENLAQSYPHLRFFSPISDGVSQLVQDKFSKHPGLDSLVLIPEPEKYDLFNTADVALACSGTVTTQLAALGVPTVVSYKLSPATFFIAKRLFKPSYISLINISAGKELMPEFVQDDSTPENLMQSIGKLIENEDFRSRVSTELTLQADVMKGKGGSASKRAARAILNLL